ncbi:dihydrofolate reductase-like domain-containing protein [Trichoderma novae-zelandiae]
MTAPELTLIVAATRSMGIGFQGTMPWKGLKREMQYFARVTTRVPASSQAPQNAVIMGRKTWDSIPPKFRPLKNRLNIIITRSATTPHPPSSSSLPSSPSSASASAAPSTPASSEIRVPSVEAALQYAHEASAGTGGRVFVMGGAQIYEAALRHPAAKRVLLTRIEADFDCDVFFPLDLRPAADGGGAGAGAGAGAGTEGWRRRSREELQRWTGEEVEEGGQEEAGIRYEFEMWERE